MFVSRTVAAEVCMEAKANDVGYGALKQLDKSGHLRFSLSCVAATHIRLSCLFVLHNKKPGRRFTQGGNDVIAA